MLCPQVAARRVGPSRSNVRTGIAGYVVWVTNVVSEWEDGTEYPSPLQVRPVPASVSTRSRPGRLGTSPTPGKRTWTRRLISSTVNRCDGIVEPSARRTASTTGIEVE